MLSAIEQQTLVKMQKTLEFLYSDLAKIRTGRAHPDTLDHVKVVAYGNTVPLKQICNVSVLDARTLLIQPWDDKLLSAIEKGIREADNYLNPVPLGKTLRLPLPPLTEERRKTLVKFAKQEAEGARIKIRNLRRDANNSFKEHLKKKEISIDEEHRAQDKIQKKTDDFIARIDKALEEKESELMKV